MRRTSSRTCVRSAPASATPTAPGHPRRRPELPEHLPQRAGPLPGRRTGPRGDQGGLHQVGAGLGRLGQAGQGGLDLGVVTLLAPRLQARHRRALGLRVGGLDGGVQVGGQRGRLGGLVAVDAHDLVLAGLDATAPGGVRGDHRLLHVAGLDGRDGTAHRLHPVHLGAGTGDEVGDLGLHHRRALEQVVVLQQVGLEGQHLLEAQRPLLVPRPGQAERLVPRRQLYGAGAGVLGQRHAEHLEHDPLHVVLGLRLGQAQAVDLHAVPEPAHLVVLDAVALAGQLVPELDERAHLAHLLDEPHAGVDEERDAPDDLREVLGGDLAGVAHGVEHRDRRAEGVGQLLGRRRAGLLEVVAADVDRVPLGDLVDGVGDQVAGQPQGVLGREDVGPAGEVLLDDVVLGGAGQRAVHVLEPVLGVPAGDRLLLGDDLVEREQPHRGRVDRHRRVHGVERDPVEQPPHLPQVRDRHADLADLAARERVVRVVAGLGRQVEGHRESGLALRQVRPVERVGVRRRAVPGVGPHHPGTVLRVAHGLRVRPR